MLAAWSLGVPGLVTFGGLVPPVATVSLVPYVAAGVPAHSVVVVLRGSVLECCWIDASLGVLLQLVSFELEIHGFLYFSGMLCCFCGLSTHHLFRFAYHSGLSVFSFTAE